MKKLISLLIVTALGASVFTACAGNTAETAAPEETAAAAETQAAEEAFSYEMTDDLNNLFATAMEGLVGANYEPVAYLGVPADNPLGSSFLCKATAVVPDAVPYYAIVTVQDVGDSVTVEDVQVIDYAASSTAAEASFAADNGEGAMVGAWEDAASEDLTGAVTAEGVTPVAVLATQLVSGTNYCCLTRNDANDGWNLTYVYQDLQGGAEVTNTAALGI